MKNENEKRLFFGAEVTAPWPETYPPGRIIEVPFRHITLAFLGNCSLPSLQSILPTSPKPDFKIGPAGKSDRLLFLPKHHPRVVAMHIEWLQNQEQLNRFQKNLLAWLEKEGYKVDKRELLSHVTLARSPFDPQIWGASFTELPLYIKAIHLYESVGELRYLSRWEYPFTPPFVEIEHTADIAFHIRGHTLHELYLHAALALCFKYPSMTAYFSNIDLLHSFEDIVAALNALIAKVDVEIGSPLKAVSYHGEVKKNAEGLMEWEMIVDV